MIRDIYEDIRDGVEIRKNLIELKLLLKKEDERRALKYYIGSNGEVFFKLLNSEDAKIRKNAALVIGELNLEGGLEYLMNQYQKEETLFVRGSYLIGMSGYHYEGILLFLKEKLEELTSLKPDKMSEKHIDEEIKILTEMILEKEKPSTHQFTGYHVKSDVILITNRDFKMITGEQITNGIVKELNAGVMVRTSDLEELLQIRTYSEMLFSIDGVRTVEGEIEEIASALIEGGFVDFLKARHKGKTPFYFRIEMKSRMQLDKKSTFTKKLANELEKKSQRELINSTSNYEIELRLIENKKSGYHVLVKLFTMKDERFEYRKNVMSTSISPYNAALVVRLGKEYLKEQAQILDPFCGVGTMLIERHKYQKANTMYGLDTMKEAIDKAKENTEAAHSIVHYINRNFFDFKHEYLFDEIVTNAPVLTGRNEDLEILDFYYKFFIQADQVLKEDGIILIHIKKDKPGFLKAMRKSGIFVLLKEYRISLKEETSVFVCMKKPLYPQYDGISV